QEGLRPDRAAASGPRCTRGERALTTARLDQRMRMLLLYMPREPRPKARVGKADLPSLQDGSVESGHASNPRYAPLARRPRAGRPDGRAALLRRCARDARFSRDRPAALRRVR